LAFGTRVITGIAERTLRKTHVCVYHPVSTLDGIPLM